MIRKRGARQHMAATSGRRPSIPKDMFVNTAAPEPSPGRAHRIREERRPGDEGRPAAARRRLHGGRAAEVRGRCPAPAGVLFATSPFKERRSDFNVWGLVPAAQESGISRPSTGIHRSNPDRQHLRRLRLRALRAGVRQQGVPPPSRPRALRRRRDRGQRRAPTAAAGSTASTARWRPTTRSRPTSSSTSSATTSPRWPTSTTRRRWPTCRGHARRAVGAERHGAARSEHAEMEGSGQAGHAAADAVAEGSVTRRPRASRRRRRAKLRSGQAARGGDGRAVRRGAARDDAMFARSRGKVGAFEGAHYEAKGYYRPEANCIMFTRSGLLLRGLPPRARAGDRHLFAQIDFNSAWTSRQRWCPAHDRRRDSVRGRVRQVGLSGPSH